MCQMICKSATEIIDGRWICALSGDCCVYLVPNSKRCAEEYGEGPDSDEGEVEQ